MNVREAYQVLELEYGASLEQIKSARATLIRVWHPDRFSHAPDLSGVAGQKTAKINDAFDTLSSAIENGTLPLEGLPSSAANESDDDWDSGVFEEFEPPTSPLTNPHRKPSKIPRSLWWSVGMLLLWLTIWQIANDYYGRPVPQYNAALATAQEILEGLWRMPTGDMLRFTPEGERSLRISLEQGVELRSFKGQVQFNGVSWMGTVSGVRADDKIGRTLVSMFEFSTTRDSTLPVRTEFLRQNADGSKIIMPPPTLILRRALFP